MQKISQRSLKGHTMVNFPHRTMVRNKRKKFSRSKNLNTTLEEFEPLDTQSAKDDFLPEKTKYEIFFDQITNMMREQKVVPTPANFSLYFEKALDEQEKEFREEIEKILSIQKDSSDEVFLLEQKLKEGFREIKEAMSLISNIYKNTVAMRNITLGYMKTIQEEKISSFVKFELLKKQQEHYLKNIVATSEEIKVSYKKTGDILKSINNSCSVNNVLGVRNKKYLLERIDKEIQLIAKTEHESSCIAIGLNKDYKKDLISKPKALNMVLKFIAKILQKAYRQGDCIAHYDKDLFCVLLSHCTIEEAVQITKRTLSSIENSHFYIGHTMQEVIASAGITKVEKDLNTKEVLYFSMKALEEADMSFERYRVCLAGKDSK